MYARSTTFYADPQRIEAGIPYVRDEVMPAVEALDDCLGLSVLVDRDNGRCIVTTSWRSAEGMHVSRDRVTAMRERAGELIAGKFEVQEWEIGLVHRASTVPDGAWARVTWTRGNPAGVDDLVSSFRTGILPRLDDLPGFCSTSLLLDRSSGLCALTSVYTDRDAMLAAGGDVRAMRERFVDEMRLAVVDIAEMEVAVHSLRVPELA